MGIYKHPNSPYWYYTFTLEGKRFTESTRTSNKTLAREIYEARRVDFLRDQLGIQKKKRLPLSRLAKDFLEWSRAHKKSYRRDVILVDHFLNYFRGKDTRDISSLDVERYKQKRNKEVAPATVNREVACLKRMFNLAIEWEIASDNPVKGVKLFPEPKRSFRWWNEEEIRKFLNVSDDKIRAITLIGLNTGMRIGEMLSLRWSNIDFDNNYITIEESKGNTYRKVKMNSIVKEVLKDINTRNEFIFTNYNGKPLKSIRKSFVSTCKRAGIDRSTPHVMRHTFASHLTMLGVDPTTIMELGGWKSLELVQRYSHLAPDHKQKAVDKLAQMLNYCLNEKKPG